MRNATGVCFAMACNCISKICQSRSLILWVLLVSLYLFLRSAKDTHTAQMQATPFRQLPTPDSTASSPCWTPRLVRRYLAGGGRGVLVYVCVRACLSKHWQFMNGAGGGGGANINGKIMRAGCRPIRAFTIPSKQSSYRRGGLVAIARQKEGWWF